MNLQLAKIQFNHKKTTAIAVVFVHIFGFEIKQLKRVTILAAQTLPP
jgi:ligand-binding sensor protein